MYPITLETIIYLKYNQDWWGMAEVHKATEMDIGDLNEDMQDIINNDDNSDEEAWWEWMTNMLVCDDDWRSICDGWEALDI